MNVGAFYFVLVLTFVLIGNSHKVFRKATIGLKETEVQMI